MGLKDLLKDHDLPQKAVEVPLSCGQLLYSKYERGKREVPLSIVDRLAEYYKTGIDYLIGQADAPTLYLPAKRK